MEVHVLCTCALQSARRLLTLYEGALDPWLFRHIVTGMQGRCPIAWYMGVSQSEGGKTVEAGQWKAYSHKLKIVSPSNLCANAQIVHAPPFAGTAGPDAAAGSAGQLPLCLCSRSGQPLAGAIFSPEPVCCWRPAHNGRLISGDSPAQSFYCLPVQETHLPLGQVETHVMVVAPCCFCALQCH